jgi:hypothetical protein
MIITNDEVVERARAIAARRRDGGSFSKYLDRARAELQQPTNEIKKVVKRLTATDETLRKKGAAAQLRHHQPGVGDPDPDRRVEVGECETSLGRLRVSVSADSLAVHGVNVLLADLDKDLRGAIVTTAAAFSAAAGDIEQAKQRAIIGILIDGVLRRDKFLTASVKAARARERYDV